MTRVRPVSIAIAYDGRMTERHRVAHLILVDSDGNVHERFSDQPPGLWTQWKPDHLPKRQPQRARRTRKE